MSNDKAFSSIFLAVLMFSQNCFSATPKPVTAGPAPATMSTVLNFQDAFARVAEQIKPAVVSITSIHIEAVQPQPFEFYFGDPFDDFYHDDRVPPQGQRRGPPGPRGMQRRSEGLGSGVVIDPKGYILTNEHVVHAADEIQVRITDGGEQTYRGKVVGKDASSDLAVVKIEPKKPLKYATLGDSSAIRIGDWAIAVGSPFGFDQTVTAGIISAVRQSLNIGGQAFADFIQTDAAINMGNSGGPLLNIQGQVIGINTIIVTPSGAFAGIGFAIPSNRAKDIMQELIQKGRVVRGWLGVEIAPMDDVLAQQFGVPDKSGVVINRVLADSPAAKAGFRRGDVVREFGATTVKEPRDLQQAVAKTAPKKTVNVAIIRDGKKMNLALVTGEMPAGSPSNNEEGDPGQPETPDASGATFDWEGARFGTVEADDNGVRHDGRGVEVLSVGPTGAGYELGLEEGDIVMAVNRKATPDLDAFRRVIRGANIKQGVLFDVIRDGRGIYLSYKKAE